MRSFLVWLFAAFLLVAAPAHAFFSLKDTKNAMVDFLLDQLSTEGVFEITAEELSEDDEGRTAVKGLKIADEKGVWFTADALSFSWNRSRLLRGEVELESLILSGVNMTRAPVQPPTLDPEVGVEVERDTGLIAWPRSPITVRVERLAAKDVNIAEAVFGHAIRFDAEGSFRDEGDIQAAELEVTRTDAIAGEIDIDYARNFDDNTLKIALSANEDAGGLVAHLFDLPRDAPSRLTLEADGPPSDWRASFDLDLADTLTADGRAAISYEGPLDIDAQVTARPGPQMSENVRILFGEEAKLDVRVVQRDDGAIEVRRARISSPELALQASGTFAPETGTSDLEISLDAGERLAEPFDWVDFDGLVFRGSIKGPPENIRATGQLSLAGLQTQPVDVADAQLKIDVTSVVEDAKRLTTMDVTGAVKGLRLDQVPAETIGEAEIKLVGKLDGDELQLDTAAIRSDILEITASGGGNIADEQLDFSFGLTAPRIAPVAKPYGIDAQGRIEVAGTFRQRQETMTLTSTFDLQNFTHPLVDARRLLLEGSVAIGPDGTDFDVSGNGEQLRIDQITSETLGEAKLAAKGRIRDDVLTLEKAAIESAILTATASGSLDLDGDETSLTFNAQAPRLSAIAEAYGIDARGAIDIDGTVRAADGVQKIAANFELNDFFHPAISAEQLRLEGVVQLADGGTSFDLSGTGRTLRIDQLPADTIGQARLSAKGKLVGETLTLDSASIESDVLTLQASGTAATDGSRADIDFRASTPRIAPIAQAYGIDAKGAIALDGSLRIQGGRQTLRADFDLTDFAHPIVDAGRLNLGGTVEVTDQAIAFDLSGSGQRLRIDRIGPDALGRADLAVSGELRGERLRIEKLMIDAPLLAATASGSIDTDRMTGRVRYDIARADLAALGQAYGQPVAGQLAGEGTLILPQEGAPRLSGNARVAALSWDGTRYGDLTLAHDLTLSDTPSGDIDLALSGSPFGPARLDTRFRLDGDRLTLDGLDLAAVGLNARGDLVVDTAAPGIDGTLRVTSRDLSSAGQFAGIAVRGSGGGVVEFTTRGGGQTVRTSLDLNGLTLDGTTIRGASLDATVRNAFATPRIDARADLTGVDLDGTTLQSVEVVARGPLSGLDITADASGIAFDRAFSATLDARVNAAGNGVVATVNRLEGLIGEDRLRLEAPARIVNRGGTTRIEGLDLTLPDGGSLRGDITLAGRPVAGNLRAELPALDFLDNFVELPVAGGGLTAEVTFDGSGGRAVIRGDRLRFDEIEVAGALDVAATATWEGRRLSLTGQVGPEIGNPLVFSAELPLARAGGVPEIASRGPVNGRIDWRGDIGTIWALLPLPGHILTGDAVIDLGVSGDISDPQISGGVRLTDGTYQNLDLGTVLTDVNLSSRLIGDGDLGITLTASDGAKGTVDIRGRVALDASGIDLTGRINQAVLVRRDDVTARTDGTITIKGPATDLKIAGDIVITDAEVRLVNATSPSIVTLDNVRFKGQPRQVVEDGNGVVDLNLHITSPGRIFVRGRGLDSQWQADVRIYGTVSDPRVKGTIEKVRGRFDLIGRGFELSTGVVRFDGGKEIDPTIDLVLTRSAESITGNIVISGRVSDPELRFTSSPTLPSDEVMPRLLFGQSRQALTASQALQLSLGIATLLDGGAGTLDQARTAIGLDTLRVEQDEEGNTAIAVGNEVTEGVFVGVERSLATNETKVTVEIDVFDNTKIDIELEPTGDASVGVEWRKDF